MGFYIRKSISAGPFRFNISKSGLGVSAGIKGFRIGSGPRGNYIHAGRNGFYYRKSITRQNKLSPDHNIEASNYISTDPTHGPMQAVDSQDVNRMIDSSSVDLIEEIRSKHKKISKWPIYLIMLAIFIWIISSLDTPKPIIYMHIITSIIIVYLASVKDIASKTVVLFYDFDDNQHAEDLYRNLFNSINQLGACNRIWYLEGKADVYKKRYHAGAEQLVDRKRTKIIQPQSKYFRTNVAINAINVGKQNLYFLPDRLLVFEGKSVGSIDYKNLSIDVETFQFVESESVPNDAQIVGSTWRYVNNSGEPDRRFRSNYEIPVCLYETIMFYSTSGLNEQLKISQCGLGTKIKNAIQATSSIKSLEKQADAIATRSNYEKLDDEIKDSYWPHILILLVVPSALYFLFHIAIELRDLVKILF